MAAACGRKNIDICRGGWLLLGLVNPAFLCYSIPCKCRQKEVSVMKRLGRKWKNALPVICFLCLALTLAMAVYTYQYEPDRYQAVYTFYALPANVNADEAALQSSRMLALDCNELLQTRSFQEKVLKSVQSDGQTIVIARGVDGTHLIRVEAVGLSPITSQLLANAAGREMISGALLGAADMKEISKAEVPTVPYAPNRPVKVAAMLIASFLGLSLAGLLLGSSREPIRWGRALSAPLPIPCLGGVRRFDRAAKRARQKGNAGCCTLQEGVSRYVQEDVRKVVLALRTMQEHPGCAVVTTGLDNDADCAPVTLLMAIELAAQGFDVLLMEMNAYEPTLREWLHVAGRCDVLDCVRDEGALKTAILPTAVPRLCFIDACHAPGFVATIASSTEFFQFVSDAAHSFDYVFLNAPPAGSSCDAAMLGAAADVTLVMTADGRYTANELESDMAELKRSVRRLSGFIVTNVRGRRSAADR